MNGRQKSALGLTVVGFLGGVVAMAGEAQREPQSIHNQLHSATHQEVKMVEGDLNKEYMTLQSRLSKMNQDRTQLKAELMEKATQHEKGLELMDQYLKVLDMRYMSESGKFDPYAAVNARDIQNMNAIFMNYLNSNPLQGPVSAERAKRELVGAKELLKKKISELRNPDPENNSSMAILKGDEERTQKRMAVIKELEPKFGLNFSEGPKPASVH